jgi:tRNA(adenine34) deaminase
MKHQQAPQVAVAGRGCASATALGSPAMKAEPGFDAVDAAMMRLALRHSAAASERDETPIGAVLARGEEVLAAAGNEREQRADPTAHAEILVLREAAAAAGGWRLPDTTLYVTLEPCSMCAGAIVLARVPRVVYAAADPKAGAAGSVLNVLAEPRLNHRPVVESGLLAEEAAEQLRSFFRERR